MTVPPEPWSITPEPEPAAPNSAPSSSSLQDAAVRGSWWTAVQAGVGVPLALAANIVVARSLGPHGYGLLASYTAAYALILVVLNAGISDATIQWVAAAHARGDRAELLEVTRKCAGFHLIFEAPVGAIAAAVLLHDESIAIQVVAALAIAVTMAIGTTTVVLTATGRNAALAKQSLLIGLALQLAVVTAAAASHSAGATWAARLAVAVLAPLAALWIAAPDVRRATLRPLIPHRWPPGFSAFAARTLVATLVTTLVYSRSEILILDSFSRTEAAGLFALAAGLAVQITAPVDAILAPLVPAAAALVAIDRARAGDAVLRGVRLSALATGPLIVLALPVVAILAPLIYGSDFGQTGELFIALGMVSGVQSVLHPVTAFVTALRRPTLVLAINGGALVVDLVLVVSLGPTLGAVGAVIGNSAGQLISLAGAVLLLRRHLGLSLRATAAGLAPFVAIAVVAAVAASAGLYLDDHGTSRWLSALAGVGGAVVIGLLVLRAVGGLARDTDVTAVQDGLPAVALRLIGSARRLGMIDGSRATDGPSRVSS